MSQAMRYDKVINAQGEFDIIFGQVRIHCRQVHSDLPCPMSLAMLLRVSGDASVCVSACFFL